MILSNLQPKLTYVIVTDIMDSGFRDCNSIVIQVDDINKAYWRFVAYYRSLFNIPIIGVTGTCGKTTTTEMLKTILSKRFKTHASSDGRNNWFLSLPYLLGIDDNTKMAVFEMGVTKPGELEFICKHYQPEIGILLNIGTYHLLGCKTQENYIKAKAELVKGLGQKGILILNSDDENIKSIDLTPFKGKIITFGTDVSADFRAEAITQLREGVEFKLHHQRKAYQVYVPGYGEHNIYNACAAIAAAFLAGIDIKDAISGLASYQPISQHLQLRKGINGSTIIDDTWNCNPPSMESALNLLGNLSKSKKSVAVLGYMPQLGVAGYKEYDRMGVKAADLAPDYLILIGEEAKKIGLKAMEMGFNKEKVFFCSSAAELYQRVASLADHNTIFLFKFPYKFRLSNDPSYTQFMKKV